MYDIRENVGVLHVKLGISQFNHFFLQKWVMKKIPTFLHLVLMVVHLRLIPLLVDSHRVPRPVGIIIFGMLPALLKRNQPVTTVNQIDIPTNNLITILVRWQRYLNIFPSYKIFYIHIFSKDSGPRRVGVSVVSFPRQRQGRGLTPHPRI